MPRFSVAPNSALLGNSGGLLGGETGLEEGADQEDVTPRSDALLNLGRGIAGSVESGATFAKDVMSGEADPADTGRLFDMIGLMGGPGLLAAKPGAVGMLGGKVTKKPRKIIDADELQADFTENIKLMEPTFKERQLLSDNFTGDKAAFMRGGNEMEFMDEFQVPGAWGATVFRVTPLKPKPGKGNTLASSVEFDVHGFDEGITAAAKIKAGQKVLNTVFDGVEQFVKQSGAERITYNAATSNLVKPYKRATERLAKKFNAKIIHNGEEASNDFFELEFPNPRHYKAE